MRGRPTSGFCLRFKGCSHVKLVLDRKISMIRVDLLKCDCGHRSRSTLSNLLSCYLKVFTATPVSPLRNFGSWHEHREKATPKQVMVVHHHSALAVHAIAAFSSDSCHLCGCEGNRPSATILQSKRIDELVEQSRKRGLTLCRGSEIEGQHLRAPDRCENHDCGIAPVSNQRRRGMGRQQEVSQPQSTTTDGNNRQEVRYVR